MAKFTGTSLDSFESIHVIQTPVTLLRSALFHIHTLYLFSKSDIKTLIFPVTLFSLATSPSWSLSGLAKQIFWTWIHLLHCCFSNQRNDGAEDGQNKPWRPIPSGRITAQQTTYLRDFSIPLCFAVSAFFGTGPMQASVALMLFMYAYDDLGLKSRGLTKVSLNAIGYGCFEMGATLVLSGRQSLDHVALYALLCNMCIILTTTHTQDFYDIEGDIISGRRTLPILFPELSRKSVPILLIGWSIGLSALWGLGTVMSGLVVAAGAFVGCRFLWLRGVSEDTQSFFVYNIWLTMVHALPVIAR